MVARNVVVKSLSPTNPFRSRFDSGHRQIGDLSWFESSVEGYFFFHFFLFFPPSLSFFSFLFIFFPFVISSDYSMRNKIVDLSRVGLGGTVSCMGG